MQKFILFILVLTTITFSYSQTGTTASSDEIKLFIQDLNWSPDGKYILFSALLGKSDWSDFAPTKWGLYEILLPTKDIFKISDAAEYGSYSPGRRQIAYSHYELGKWRIVMDEVSMGEQKALTDKSSNSRCPSFSPDGSQIVFLSDRDNDNELYIMNHDGTSQQRLTYSKNGKPFNPAFSPDGKTIAYYFEKGDHKDQIYVLNLVKLLPENITNDEFNNVFPGWINGNTLMYSTNGENEASKVYRIDFDGSNKQQVASIESFYARYSLDGAKIAYITKTSDGANITIANANGLMPQQLLDVDAFKRIFPSKR